MGRGDVPFPPPAATVAERGVGYPLIAPILAAVFLVVAAIVAAVLLLVPLILALILLAVLDLLGRVLGLIHHLTASFTPVVVLSAGALRTGPAGVGVTETGPLCQDADAVPLAVLRQDSPPIPISLPLSLQVIFDAAIQGWQGLTCLKSTTMVHSGCIRWAHRRSSIWTLHDGENSFIIYAVNRFQALSTAVELEATSAV